MATTGAPLPVREPLVQSGGLISEVWQRSLVFLRQDVDASPRRELEAVERPTASEGPLTAAIGTTAIPSGLLAAGYYRVSTFLRVVTAAGVSSQMQITISYTCAGVACAEVGTLLNANAVNVPQSDVFVVRIDASTPISYSVAYASNPASVAAYQLGLVLERLSA